ncbi:MAG: DUF1893 domain-containing protein [Parcubacteria group bacterium]|jgi:hypothetical protein
MKKAYNLDYFSGKSWSFVLIKKGKIVYRSKADRLKPLIDCIRKFKKEMRGAKVFDKVIGRAAAILFSYAKVGEVWTPVISQGGKRILRKNNIRVDYKREVDNIRNQKGDDLCPMEKMSLEKGDKIIKILLGK